jgi:lycopene cyclase CruA
MSFTPRQFDLVDLRSRFPETVARISALENGESHLRRIHEIEQRWQKARSAPEETPETIEFIDRSCVVDTVDFDIIYAGGTLGLLHAAVMSRRYRRKVLVVDAHRVGETHRDWNISDEELRAFVRVGLFSEEEIEQAVVNRYRTGFVKFSDTNSSVKTPKLFMDNVLDVAIDANVLLELAKDKLIDAGSVVLDGHLLKDTKVFKNCVEVSLEDSASGTLKTLRAKLLCDATGTNSDISRQLNRGRSITHICPTVGTVATGFVHGKAEDEVDFDIGEILVSTEDITDGRQLIWEGFAGSREKDEYTTYLFFYDSVESAADKSLFPLFEEYFRKLSTYKKPGPNWKVVKPVYGYIPSIHHHTWKNAKRTAADRILLIGDAAGLSSPLTFCGFGSHVRNLERLTEMTETAFKQNAFNEMSLSEINAYEANVSQMASLAEFMRPMPQSESFVVNETMNAVMKALENLDPEIRKQLFQDRVTFKSFAKVLKETATLHPKVFKLMFEHLGVKGAFWWIANIAKAAIEERSK